MSATTPFKFKQFTVKQTRSAMKVGFDGILLGAWSAVDGCHRILDVGTGTGLVALMLAQRSGEGTIIDAIDIDQDASEEALDNFQTSRWSHRLTAAHIRLEDFANGCRSKYDLVVCNPPYFDGIENSGNKARSRARHACSLSLRSLFSATRRVLADSGRLCLIMPIDQTDACRAEANHVGWTTRRELRVRPLPDRPIHRILVELGNHAGGQVQPEELTIEVTHHVYTAEFKKLTRDFYLAF